MLTQDSSRLSLRLTITIAWPKNSHLLFLCYFLFVCGRNDTQANLVGVQMC